MEKEGEFFQGSLLNRVLGVLACSRAWHAYVLGVLTCLRAHVHGMLTPLRAHVHGVLGVLACVSACLFVLFALHFNT